MGVVGKTTRTSAEDRCDGIRVVGARERNLTLVQRADWIPDGGGIDGEIVSTGTPEKPVAAQSPLTGNHPKRYQSAIFSCSDQRRLP